MSYSIDTLTKETMGMWSKISREVPNHSFKLDSPKKEIKRALEGYEAARTNTLGLVILGESAIRDDDVLVQNFGTLATETQTDQKMMKLFLAVATNASGAALKKIAETHMTKGSVLNDSNWWIYRNDLFMLGGIHGGSEFHLASKKLPDDDLLWDKDHQRPRVLGRELIMLSAAGYRRVQSASHLGFVFVPPGSQDVRMISLTACRNKIASIKSVEEIKKIFSQFHASTCD